MTKTVKEFSANEPVEDLSLLVEKRSEAVTKSGKAYLNLTLRDKTASINAKLWGYDDIKHGFIKEGEVITIWAGCEDYNGALQLNVKDVRASDMSVHMFARSTKFDIEKMWGDLVNTVGSFTEPLTKFVAEEILTKHAVFIDAYKKAPAAKIVHNNWHGGLLEHVHALCLIAEPVIKHYHRYSEKLSRDKVLFGLMMHDAGKVIEYDYTKPSFNLTTIGVFTNHIVIGPAWVYETANRFPDKSGSFKIERAHLMHILASHHGKVEWGSPIAPASLEAVLVHHLDNLDAKMMHALEFVDGKPGPIAGFSEKSYFEGTSFYQYPQQ